VSALTHEAWLAANDHYLALAVEWLSLLLSLGVEDEQTQAAADAVALAAAVEPPPALVEVGVRLGLTSFEYNVLLLCIAVELDDRISRLCAKAHADTTRSYPTFGLALSLFEEGAWTALAPDRPLRYWRLIEIHQPGAQPLTASALRADERMVAAAKGVRQIDDRIALLATPLEDPLPAGATLPPSQRAVVESILRRVRTLAVSEHHDRRPPPLQLIGRDSPSKLLVAAVSAGELGLWLYRLPVEALPEQLAEVETLARLWEREAYLLPVALYVEVRDAEPRPLLGRFLARANGLIFVDLREAYADLGDGSTLFEVSLPMPKEQELLWRAAIGSRLRKAPALLAARYNFDTAAIFRFSAEATTQIGLEQICRRSARLHMHGLAHRITPRAHLSQVILPPEPIDLLKQIIVQARHRVTVYDGWGFRQRLNRGLGISALFAGDSGTGKTMAAEAIANELGIDLYRIDLSAVVSKYIGETEKNLRRVFDAAETGSGILFFDEADALFARRTEVKDSHDRYANIEVNYLLQRMEDFNGLVILATNLKSALDPAFLRRLRFVVNFPFPSLQDRRRIWQNAFPPRAAQALSGADWDRLAKFHLTGGHIANIALNASFVAAGEGKTSVEMRHILSAARAEYGKLERPINEAEFR
jgi:predicted nucleic acid-binding protein